VPRSAPRGSTRCAEQLRGEALRGLGGRAIEEDRRLDELEHRPLGDRVAETRAEEHERGLAPGVDRGQVRLDERGLPRRVQSRDVPARRVDRAFHVPRRLEVGTPAAARSVRYALSLFQRRTGSGLTSRVRRATGAAHARKRSRRVT